MVSRFQLRTPVSDAPLPLQETVPAQSPSTIATYSIEPELLGVRPRLVTVDFLRLGLFDGATPFLLAFVIYSFVSMYDRVVAGKMTLAVYVFLCGVLMCLALTPLVYQEIKRKTDLLRRGIATPATILAIETLPHGVRLTVTVQHASGQKGAVLPMISSRRFAKQNLAVGDTFTLLVSPENEHDMLPYFLCAGHRVVPVEATPISHDVSARLAAQVATTPLSFPGRWGAIEPELIGTAMRNVRLTSEQRSKYFWIFACFPFLAAILPVALKQHFPLSDSFMLLLTVIAVNLAWRTGSRFVLPYESIYLLERGIAARARIVDGYIAPSSMATPDRATASYIYEYETFTSAKITGNLVLPVRRAWQLGLAEGATFTVLYSADNSAHHKPYFEITDAEIVGAMGAKVASP